MGLLRWLGELAAECTSAPLSAGYVDPATINPSEWEDGGITSKGVQEIRKPRQHLYMTRVEEEKPEKKGWFR